MMPPIPSLVFADTATIGANGDTLFE